MVRRGLRGHMVVVINQTPVNGPCVPAARERPCVSQQLHRALLLGTAKSKGPSESRGRHLRNRGWRVGANAAQSRRAQAQVAAPCSSLTPTVPSVPQITSWWTRRPASGPVLPTRWKWIKMDSRYVSRVGGCAPKVNKLVKRHPLP